MAVKTFRGNTVIRLLIMLESPTASESSISILQTKEWDRLSGRRKSQHISIHTNTTYLFLKVCIFVLVPYSSTSKHKMGKKISGFFFPPLLNTRKNQKVPFSFLRASIPTHLWYSVIPQWSVLDSQLGILHRGRWVHEEKLTGQGTAENLVPYLNLLWFFDVPVRKNY